MIYYIDPLYYGLYIIIWFFFVWGWWLLVIAFKWLGSFIWLEAFLWLYLFWGWCITVEWFRIQVWGSDVLVPLLVRNQYRIWLFLGGCCYGWNYDCPFSRDFNCFHGLPGFGVELILEICIIPYNGFILIFCTFD